MHCFPPTNSARRRLLLFFFFCSMGSINSVAFDWFLKCTKPSRQKISLFNFWVQPISSDFITHFIKILTFNFIFFHLPFLSLFPGENLGVSLEGFRVLVPRWRSRPCQVSKTTVLSLAIRWFLQPYRLMLVSLRSPTGLLSSAPPLLLQALVICFPSEFLSEYFSLPLSVSDLSLWKSNPLFPRPLAFDIVKKLTIKTT